MNIRSLEVFRAIMQTGSTTTAGQALQLSQSAISRQLTGLEEDLGLVLFHRDRGRLIPTAEAKTLLPQIAGLVDDFAKMRRHAEDLKAGKAGDLLIKIAVPQSLVTTLVPDVIARFSAERPYVSVEVLAGPYDAIERMVLDREADVGFVRLPTAESGFHVRPILRSRLVCALPAGHPLEPEAVIAPHHLAGADLILIGRNRSLGRVLGRSFDKLRPPARCVINVHSVAAACALVAVGQGLSIVPAHIGTLFADRTVMLRPLAEAVWNDYGIVSRLSPVSAATQVLVGLVADAFRAMTFETEVVGDP